MPTLSHIYAPPHKRYFIHTLPGSITNNNNRENLVSLLYDLHISALKTDVRMRVAISCDPLSL